MCFSVRQEFGRAQPHGIEGSGQNLRRDGKEASNGYVIGMVSCPFAGMTRIRFKGFSPVKAVSARLLQEDQAPLGRHREKGIADPDVKRGALAYDSWLPLEIV